MFNTLIEHQLSYIINLEDFIFEFFCNTFTGFKICLMDIYINRERLFIYQCFFLNNYILPATRKEKKNSSIVSTVIFRQELVVTNS